MAKSQAQWIWYLAHLREENNFGGVAEGDEVPERISAIVRREAPVERVSRTPRERFPFSCALELDALFAVVEALRAAAFSDRRFDAFSISSFSGSNPLLAWF